MKKLTEITLEDELEDKEGMMLRTCAAGAQ